MKVKFTLDEEEGKALRKVFGDIPTDLCGFVKCPDMEGNACENCPMASVQQKWEKHYEHMIEEFLPMVNALER